MTAHRRTKGPGGRYTIQRRAAIYGITPERIAALEEAAAGRCAICGTTPDKPLGIDHDHTTGQVRGMLCGLCNLGLGYFKDSSDRLAAAITYLNAAS